MIQYSRVHCPAVQSVSLGSGAVIRLKSGNFSHVHSCTVFCQKKSKSMKQTHLIPAGEKRKVLSLGGGVRRGRLVLQEILIIID